MRTISVLEIPGKKYSSCIFMINERSWKFPFVVFDKALKNYANQAKRLEVIVMSGHKSLAPLAPVSFMISQILWASLFLAVCYVIKPHRMWILWNFESPSVDVRFYSRAIQFRDKSDLQQTDRHKKSNSQECSYSFRADNNRRLLHLNPDRVGIWAPVRLQLERHWWNYLILYF